jgi:hypothetical protein
MGRKTFKAHTVRIGMKHCACGAVIGKNAARCTACEVLHQQLLEQELERDAAYAELELARVTGHTLEQPDWNAQ